MTARNVGTDLTDRSPYAGSIQMVQNQTLMIGRHGLWERQRCVVNLRAGEVRVSHESNVARVVLANLGRYEGQGRVVIGDRGDGAVS